MRNIINILIASLIVLSVSVAFAGDTVVHGTIGIGGHITSINDYYQKAGEFNLGKDDPYPEFLMGIQKTGDIYSVSGNPDDEGARTGVHLPALNRTEVSGSQYFPEVSKLIFMVECWLPVDPNLTNFPAQIA